MFDLIMICFLSMIFVFCIVYFGKKENVYIIRTYNEENSIESKLRMSMLKYNKIIVLDCDSCDSTKEITAKMAQDYGNIVFYSTQLNQ